MAAVAVATVPLVRVHVLPIVRTLHTTQEVDVPDHHVVPAVLHIAKIHQTTLVVAPGLLAVPVARLTVKIHRTTRADAQARPVVQTALDNVPQLVPRHVLTIAPALAVMDVQVVAAMDVKTPVLVVVVDNAACLVVAHVAESAREVALLSVSMLLKADAVADALALAA